jgi:hypothetical protein
VKFFLAGVVSLNGPRPRRSAFLIPFFKCDQSNWLFVQDLAEDRTILRFCRFDPFRYDAITDVEAVGIERAVGDVGLMSYIRANEPITVAPASEIVRQLRMQPPSHSDSPIFAIEAFSLIEDPKGVRRSIKRAAIEFGSSPWVAKWASMETSLASSLHAAASHSPDWIEENLNVLAKDLEDERWPARWRKVWTTSGHDQRLTALGAKYVHEMRSRRDRFDQAMQVLALLMTRRGSFKRSPSAEFIEELARNFTATLPPVDAGKKGRDSWGRVLSATLRGESSLSDEKTSIIHEYLRQQSGVHGRIVDVWRDLWNVLLKHGRIDVATSLLDEAEVATAKSPALQRIMRTIAARSEDPRLQSLVLEWVIKRPTYTNTWIDAYLRLLEEYKGRSDLVKAGEDWLRADPGLMRRWPQVRNALEQHTGNRMLDELRSWLLRANSNMSSWAPTVVEWLRENQEDTEIREVARSWLSQHEYAASAWELSDLLKEEVIEETKFTTN